MITALYLATNILRIYAISVFISTILGEFAYKKIFSIMAYAIFFLLNSILHLLFNNTFVNLATNIIPILLITFLYKKSNLRLKMFVVFSFCAIGMFIDWISVSILPTSFLVISNVIPSISLLVFVFILRAIFAKRLGLIINSKLTWLLILISLGTIIIGQLTISDFNVTSFVIAIILLAINFLNFYLYDIIIENLRAEQTFKLIEASNKAYQNQLDLMNESQKKVRLLKHDIVNHVYNIKNSILDKEYENALTYIDTISEYIAADREFINTGNSEINCLLNYKLALANEIGVDFSCDVSLPDQLVVSAFDLTVILGNLLDNAIDALKCVDNKRLLIDIAYSKGMIRINIENTFLPNVTNKKTDGEEHGLGLISVQKSLDKYNGVLKTSSDNERFCASVLLYNS